MAMFSCNGCPDRYPGCHGDCEKYKREAAHNEKVKEYLRKDKDILEYKQASYRRYKKRMREKRG